MIIGKLKKKRLKKKSKMYSETTMAADKKCQKFERERGI